ncbi:MAG: hypothetical protein AB202_00935 [Parcubacteria bacterium C7867-007]|nr:MAG: hypothetical protein AB202_00935 [Parcubacteria bacterium C7867-007]
MKTLLFGALALAAVVAAPSASYALTYAYVNQSGEVMTMEAANPNQAIMTAPNIGLHSGVMLLTDSSDPVIGDSVDGV